MLNTVKEGIKRHIVNKIIFQEIMKNIATIAKQKMMLLIRMPSCVESACSILSVSVVILEIRSPVLLASKKATSLLIICSKTSYLMSLPILPVVTRKMY